ncbi:hypothetical protein CFK37_16560 [Virgibacillus phasianinus]|uniref:Uncharacterized protein n=1 Tax=Virgibacillus phasianinus TaxID=2017483 RepID=A0A220U5S4_9BACI|nr:hypothetical protein [Virgibacillus phasianinus]ASK63654.1 hypothetical protein CFK37_16560 [Virgibacillus phasianinus]
MEKTIELLTIGVGPYGLMGLIVCGAFICYLFIKPVIQWFIALKQERILSYIMCSLLICIFTISIGFLFFQGDYVYLLKITLVCMALFGGILVIVRLLLFLFQSIFTKNV